MSAVKFGQKGPDLDAFGIPLSIGTSTFLGSIPLEVKALLPIIQNLHTSVVERCLKFLVANLENDQLTEKEYAEFQSNFGQLSPENFSILFTGLDTIVRSIIRAKVSVSRYTNDMKLLTFPGATISAISQELTSRRLSIESRLPRSSPSLPSLLNIRWRIDVAISSGNLAKVMRPSILIQVRLDR
jgi:hypothetical protein